MKSDGVPKQALGNHALTSVAPPYRRASRRRSGTKTCLIVLASPGPLRVANSVWQRIPSVARLERGTRTVSWALRTVLRPLQKIKIGTDFLTDPDFYQGRSAGDFVVREEFLDVLGDLFSVCLEGEVAGIEQMGFYGL